jgi:ABC-type molybdate transport system permease subunit
MQGQRAELTRALRRMRWRRLRELWIRLGQRLGAVLSPVVLGVVYLTLFAPFGLVGRIASRPRGWVLPRRGAAPGLAELRRQA